MPDSDRSASRGSTPLGGGSVTELRVQPRDPLRELAQRFVGSPARRVECDLQRVLLAAPYLQEVAEADRTEGDPTGLTRRHVVHIVTVVYLGLVGIRRSGSVTLKRVGPDSGGRGSRLASGCAGTRKKDDGDEAERQGVVVAGHS